MIWQIFYSKNTTINRLLIELSQPVIRGKNILPAFSKTQLILYVGKLILDKIRSYVLAHQAQFKKTRRKFGVSLRGANYVPSRVNLSGISNKSVNVNLKIKGIERNFKPLFITPKHSKFLAIPVDSRAWKKSPRQFNNLFKPRGANVLAMKHKDKRKSLDILYALTRKVFQPKTKMLPSEAELLTHVAINLQKLRR